MLGIQQQTTAKLMVVLEGQWCLFIHKYISDATVCQRTDRLMAYCRRFMEPICCGKTVGVLRDCVQLHILFEDNSVSGSVLYGRLLALVLHRYPLYLSSRSSYDHSFRAS